VNETDAAGAPGAAALPVTKAVLLAISGWQLRQGQRQTGTASRTSASP
jgi:hypothetical protein